MLSRGLGLILVLGVGGGWTPGARDGAAAPRAVSIVAQAKGTTSSEYIRGRAQRLKDMRALLNDPDSTIRLATLNEMLKSEDPALRQLGMEAGFASADQSMRALAIRLRFRPPADFVLEIAPVEGATKQEIDSLAKFGAHRHVRVKTFDDANGQMDLEGGHRGDTARLSGTLLTINFSRCQGNLRLGDGGILTGLLSCGGARASATARLF